MARCGKDVRSFPSGASISPSTDGEPSEGQDDLPLVEKVSKFPFSGNAGVAEYPNCSAAVPFRRSLDPVIDSCGFETYTLVCPACGHSFSGIIDPQTMRSYRTTCGARLGAHSAAQLGAGDGGAQAEVTFIERSAGVG